MHPGPDAVDPPQDGDEAPEVAHDLPGFAEADAAALRMTVVDATDGRILQATTALLDWLGLSQQELVGRKLDGWVLAEQQVGGDWLVLRDVPPADGGVRRAMVARSQVRHDGRDRIVEHWNPLTDGGERVASLHPAFWSHPVPMWVFDRETLRFLDVNPAAQREFGWSREAFLAMTIADIRVPEEHERLRRMTANGGHAGVAGLWRLQGADGRERITEIRARETVFGGRPAVLATAWDMSTREAALRDRAASDARLHESEERLRVALATVGVGTFRRDILADRFEISREARAVHGLLPAEGPIGLAEWFGPVPPEDRARLLAELAQGWARQDREISLLFRLPDPVTGAERHIESRGVFTYDASGRPVSSLGVVIDVTDRERAKAALAESEQRHRSVVETAADAIVTSDDAGRILSANAATLRMFGYLSADELIGRDLAILMPPEEAASHGRHIAAHRHGAPPRAIGIPGRPLLGRRQDGSHFPIELSVGSFRASGRTCLTGIIRDVTDRRAAQRALVESEQRLRLAQEAAGVGVWEVDPTSDLVRFSEESARLHNLPPDHPRIFDRDTWKMMVVPEDAVESRRRLEAAIASGGPFELQFRVCLPAGRVRWIQARGRAMPAADGGPWRVLGVHIDVTAERELEDRLRESEDRLRLTVAATDEGLWDWDLTTNRVVFSERLLTMLGFSPEEAAPDLTFWSERVHPEDMPRVRDDLDAHFAGRSPAYSNEHRLRHKDGHWVWVLDRGKIVARGAAGEPLRMVGTHQDITERRKIQAALAESEQWLRLTQDAAGIGIFDLDLGTGLVRASEASRRLFGMPPDFPECYPRDEWLRFVVPEDAEAAHATLMRNIETDGPIEYTVRVPLEDGRMRWIQILGRIVRDSGGAPILRGVNVDITERRQLEEKLRRSDERLRLAVEATGEGVWDWHEPSGSLQVSDSMIRIIGHDPAGFDVTVGTWRALVHPDDLAHVDASLSAHLEGRTASYVSEHRLRHADGRWIWVMDRGRVIERDAAGRPVRIIGMNQDITARKAIEAALAHSEARLRAVIQAVPLGILVIGTQGDILTANTAACAMLGIADATIAVGLPMLRFVAPEEVVAWQANHQRVCAGEPLTAEFEILGLGGRRLRLETASAPFALADGHTGHLAVASDVTARREAEASLRSLEGEAMRASRLSAVGAMAASLAHELNQPLSAATNYISAAAMLQARPDGGEEVSTQVGTLLDKAARQAMRAGDIVRRLRAFIGSADHELTTLRVQDLIAEAVEEAQAHLPAAAGCAFRIAVQPPSLQMFGDIVQLRLVLANLLRNAVDATARTATREIVVSAARSPGGREVEIMVEDTGPGIPPALRRRLFDPVLSSKPGGMGIGLAICRAVMEMHGGRIWAEPDAPGRGARFRLAVPGADAVLNTNLDC